MAANILRITGAIFLDAFADKENKIPGVLKTPD